LFPHVNISSFSLLPSLAKAALDMNEVEGREVDIASMDVDRLCREIEWIKVEGWEVLIASAERAYIGV